MRQQTRLRFSANDSRSAACRAALALGLIASVSACARGDQPAKDAKRVVPVSVNVPNGGSGREHQLVPFIQMARSSRDAVLAVRDYEALFTKRELVGRTMYAGQMLIKLRHQPFSVYLRFIGRNEGREVIFAPRYQGKLVAHEAPGTISSLVGTVSLEPTSARAMAEGRHPITEIGMAKMIDALLRQWEREMKQGDPDDPKVLYYPDAKLGNVECRVAVTTHEKPSRELRFYQTRVFFDKKSNFPIRLEQYGPPDQGRSEPYLVEEYMYTNIRTNVGLSDHDFDTRNRSYKF